MHRAILRVAYCDVLRCVVAFCFFSGIYCSFLFSISSPFLRWAVQVSVP